MSESEEMYLVTIARLIEKGEESPVPVSLLASELAVMPVSANQMIRKLEDAGWLVYTPYKGVSLTDKGLALALRILRHRRLWEVFLVEQLKIPASEAADMACRLEHFLPTAAADRLAAFLGNPAMTPTGSPIPPADTISNGSIDMPIGTMDIGSTCEVTRIECDHAARTFLASENITAGKILRVAGIGGNGAVLVQTDTGSSTYLSSILAKGLWVQTRRD